MFRRYKIRKKAKILIELLKEYFRDKDKDVYNALCNCKRRNIIIAKKEYVDKCICNDFDIIVADKNNTVVIDSCSGRFIKIYSKEPIEVIDVVNFHELLGLDNNTMCAWDMVIDYLTK
jgi:hypothetical protein